MFHILVVDDDKNVRRAFQTLLKAERYTVSTARNGEEALRLLDREHIDLAVVDVTMPKMDGYTFTAILRENGDRLPILMVSGKQLPEDRCRGFLAGIDDFMTKPVDETELLLRIRALLRRAGTVSERTLTVGDVTLDYDALSVTRPGERMTLPQKEFLLLYKLLSCPDQVFTRIQLMDELWGVESNSGWETVTVHIARLRKRFCTWPEFSIESVRGLGYKAVRRA